jgi:hypothetical protein
MPMYLAASILAAQLAASPGAATIAEDWAAAPPPSREAIRKVVRDIVAEEKAREAAVPYQHEFNAPRGDKYDAFADSFDEAAVPGCLRPDGLKRQPPRIGFFSFGGLLGLPFVVLAKVRGKCN